MSGFEGLLVSISRTSLKKYLVWTTNMTSGGTLFLSPLVQENGFTKEEMKVTWETQKVLGLPDLPVSCTAVRIPTFRAHSEAITIETEKPCPPDEARELLMNAKVRADFDEAIESQTLSRF